ncbi:MAG TPA: hypothetical protein VGQ09_19665 [Chitinophagaceae bacterium]|jgi:hypothetical protein|nr:hypothetical protein [Chitinophagaceae bacterium]
MPPKHFLKAGLLTVIVVAAVIICWEFYLRSQNRTISYDDGPELWSNKRARVYLPSDKATVFIGSSRIKFDLDIPTWNQETGTDAIQLAMVGSNPCYLLHDLAEDKDFKGRLIVDVTEVLFFNDGAPFRQRPDKGINFYKKQTPSEKASFQLSQLLESQFVLLDKDFFSMNAYLAKLGLKNRPGVQGNDPLPFPWEFDLTQANRQSKMHERFVKDTNLQNQVRMIWASLGRAMKSPPPTGTKLDSILALVKADVDKIKTRGGNVLFVRTPSSGPFLEGEQQGYPRKKYWERLLAITGCPGIHFMDYESLAHFNCPEFSHLSPADAVKFTKSFVQILENKSWNFPHKNSL